MRVQAVLVGLGLLVLLAEAGSSISTEGDIAISNLNLLLPYTSGKVKASFTLEGYNGCFKWFSSSPDVVTINAVTNKQQQASNKIIDDRCSTHALVTVSQNAKPERDSAWIIAEDTLTGRKIRCEVYVAQIHSIEIATTTRIIYHDDLEVIHVQARDSEGNVFSTLEGLAFEWVVSPHQSHSSNPLKLVPFADASVEVSPIVLQMELEKKKSFATLVQGMESGKVDLIAKLIEIGYSDIQTQVTLSVLEPLELDPFQPVYVTPGTLIHYKLLSAKRDYTRTIRMPNRLYQWTVTNNTVASVDQSGIVEALTLGKAQVIVQHQEMADSSATGHVFVIWPASLSLEIHPVSDGDNIHSSATHSFLVVGREYKLVIQVRDTNGHAILQNSDLPFEVVIPDEHFVKISSSKSNSVHHVRAKTQGLTNVKAVLRFLINERTRQRIPLPHDLTAQLEVVISLPVQVQPKVVKLPWDPNVQHSFQLHPQGGSGDYYWYSQDNKIVSVNSRGLITAAGKGNSEIVLSDGKSSLNTDTSQVFVVPPAQIEIVPIHREIEVGDTTIVGIRFYDSNGQEFADCTKITNNWMINEFEVFALVGDVTLDEVPALYQEHLARTCAIKRIQAKRAGQGAVVVTHYNIRAEMTFFAFDPMQVTPTEALVTVGSSYTYSVTGGPNPWLYEPAVFMATMSVINSHSAVEPVAIERLPSGKVSFRATCKLIGDHLLNIEVKNNRPQQNKFPAVRNITAMLYCHAPHSLHTYPDLEIASNIDKQNCADSFWLFPTRQSLLSSEHSEYPSQYSLKSNQVIPYHLLVKDQQGKLFHNFSSVVFKWESSDLHLAQFEPLCSSDQCKLSIQSKSGVALITASAVGYNASIITRYPIIGSERIAPNVRNQFSVRIHDDIHLEPLRQVVYLHRENLVHVEARDGSGLSSFSLNDTSKAQLERDQKPNLIHVTPVAPGTVSVIGVDRCLLGSTPVKSVIFISEVERIVLQVYDMIPIGGSVELLVQIYDSAGNLFEESQFAQMNLKYYVDNNFVELGSVLGSKSRYIVHGLAHGSSRITFTSTQQSGRTVSSPSKVVYVYSPFELIPEELTLAPGVSYQVQPIGGPPIGARISYSAVSTHVASISPYGVVTAHHVGATRIKGVSEGYDSTQNVPVPYGEDTVEVTVKTLTGILIQAGTTHMLAGAEMNVYVVGSNHETPVMYGGSGVFHWEVSNDDVLELVPHYQFAGARLADELMFSVRVAARKPGRTRISVRMESAISSMNGLQASLNLLVIDRLELETPSNIVLPLGGSYRIRTTLDYMALAHSFVASATDVCQLQNGEVFAGTRTGVCQVLIEEPETKQAVMVNVQVKSVHIIQLLLSATQEHPSYVVLPLDSTIEFQVRFLDDLAHEFDCETQAGNQLIYQINMQEIVSLRISSQGTRVTVQALSPGEVVLRARYQTGIEDFVRIRVGNSIVPNSPIVAVGGEIRFSTQSPRESSASNARWESSDTNVVSIDDRSGVALARREGLARIHLSGSTSTGTTVRVVEVNQIKVEVPSEGYFSNFMKDEYLLKVQFFYDQSQPLNISSGAVVNKLNYHCSIDPSIWAVTQPVTVNNEAYCQIRFTKSYSQQVSSASIPDAVVFQVYLQDGRNKGSVSAAQTIPFYPEVVIEGGSKQLHIYGDQPSAQIRIRHGHADPVVSSSKVSALSIYVLSKLGDTSTYLIDVLQRHTNFNEKIFISNPITNQLLEIDVFYHGTSETGQTTTPPYVGPQAGTKFFAVGESSSPLHYIFMLLLTLLALVLGYTFCVPSSVPPTPISPKLTKTRIPRSTSEASGPKLDFMLHKNPATRSSGSVVM